MQRWKKQIEADLAAPLDRGANEIAVDVPARRAGSARRRMAWMAEHLRPHGYVFDVFDPTPNRATGRFGIARFRRDT